MAIDPPTEQEIAAALERRRIPSKHEISNLLHEYFVGPIDHAVIERLDTQLQALLADTRKTSTTQDALSANIRRYFGQMWSELLSSSTLLPTPSDLAAWIAVTTPGYPRPRPYCPEPLVGAWCQVHPVAAQWRLAADGTMQTTDPTFSARTRWCVHRVHPKHSDLIGDSLWFTSSSLLIPTSMTIKEITAAVLRGHQPGQDGPVPYHLER